MKIVAEYRQRAEDCEHLAGQVVSWEQRQAILKIAASWRELADNRERMLTMRSDEVRV